MKDTDLDHACSHLGKAIGITQLLRGTVYHAQRRRVYLPIDLMSREGVTEDQLTRGEPSADLNNVVYEVASIAKVRLGVRVPRDCARCVWHHECAACCQLPLVSNMSVSTTISGSDCARQVASDVICCKYAINAGQSPVVHLVYHYVEALGIAGSLG